MSLVRLCGGNTFTTFRTASLADEEVQFLTATIREEWKKLIYKRNLETWCRFMDELTIFEDVITKNGAIIIPESLRLDNFTKVHSTHQGIVRTKQYLRIAVYRPGMSSEIEEMCLDCRICGQFLPQEELHLSPVERPEGPWIQTGMDIYSFESDHHLTIQDFHSKRPELYKLKETTTRAVIACLNDCFFTFWKPKKNLFPTMDRNFQVSHCVNFLKKLMSKLFIVHLYLRNQMFKLKDSIVILIIHCVLLNCKAL